MQKHLVAGTLAASRGPCKQSQGARERHTCGKVLRSKPKEGKHGQAAILDLLHLVLLQAFLASSAVTDDACCKSIKSCL